MSGALTEASTITNIDTVIFDIGNVISRWDIRYLYEKIIDDPQELEWFLANVVTPEWHFQHDAGRPFADTSAELIARFPDQSERILLFQERFNETNPGEVDGVVDIIERLSNAGVPLFGLSNFSHEFWPDFRKDKPVFDKFQDFIISGENQVVKPDPAIYKLALQRFDKEANQCLFIDDRAENVEAGEAMGIKGHLFTDAASLENELSRLKLL